MFILVWGRMHAQALFRCDLSAQQLLVLHSEVPDYDPRSDTAPECATGGRTGVHQCKGSGLLSGAPAVTPLEKERARPTHVQGTIL